MVAGDEARGAGADAVALDRGDGRGLQRGMLASARDSRCRRTTAAGVRCAPPRCRRCARSVGRACGAGAPAPARRASAFAKSSSDGMFAAYNSGPMDRNHWYEAGPRARLAALRADEDGAAAAAGRAHARLPHRARRRARADRRHRVLVDGLPRLQSSAHPGGGGAPACRHAACDVRRAGA